MNVTLERTAARRYIQAKIASNRKKLDDYERTNEGNIRVIQALEEVIETFLDLERLERNLEDYNRRRQQHQAASEYLDSIHDDDDFYNASTESPTSE